MFKILALLLCALFASPALAMNELQGQPFSQVEEMARTHSVTVEKLNDADTATMDSRTGPRPQPSTIYLLTLGNSVLLILEYDGAVIFSSDPVELARINKMLNRSGA